MKLIFILIYFVLGMVLSACYDSVGKHIKNLAETEYSYRRLEEQRKVSLRLLIGAWTTIMILMALVINICVVFDRKDNEHTQRIEALEKTVSELKLLDTITLEEAIDRTENQ